MNINQLNGGILNWLGLIHNEWLFTKSIFQITFILSPRISNELKKIGSKVSHLGEWNFSENMLKFEQEPLKYSASLSKFGTEKLKNANDWWHFLWSINNSVRNFVWEVDGSRILEEFPIDFNLLQFWKKFL